MFQKYKNSIFTAFLIAAMPFTVLAHNTAYKGLGAVFAILAGVVLLGVLALILTIVNLYKKNSILRIVCIVLTVPFAAFSLFVAVSLNNIFPFGVAMAMIFMIYKSIPPKTTPPPLPTSETPPDNETPD